MVALTQRPLIGFVVIALVISAAVRIAQSNETLLVGLVLAVIFSATAFVFASLLLRAFNVVETD
jgi:hypothetical protein